MIYLIYLLVYSIYFPKTEVKKQAYKAYIKDIHYLSLVESLLFAIQTRYPICDCPCSSTW